MAGRITMTVNGVEPILRRWKDPATVAVPVADFYRVSANAVRRNTMREISGDTGKGRRSVRRSGASKRRVTKLVKIFTRVYYLRFQEFGTQHIPAKRWFLKGLRASMSNITTARRQLQVDLARRMIVRGPRV